MTYSIGEVAANTGFSADTLRYYERIGLLPPPGRSPGGRRIYRERDLNRLRFIRHAQAVGFTLAEIAQLLRFRENPAGSQSAVRDVAVRKRREIMQKMELLSKMEAELNLLISVCRGEGDRCPILEHLAQD